jgi:membrane protein YqaA with SNARE-associated domain
MTEWIDAAQAWLQTWMSAQMGLWGLFFSAFLSATVLPGSSEVVLIALVTAFPEQAVPAFFVALCGNMLGCLLTFAMGGWARDGYERFRHVKVDLEGSQVAKLRRHGPPALVLSVLPLVGDALVLAAGFIKMPFWQSMLWCAVGKGMRYLLVILGMKGVLTIF